MTRYIEIERAIEQSRDNVMDIIAGKLNETGTKTIELGGDYRAYVTILGTGDGGFEAFTSTYKGREMIGEGSVKYRDASPTNSQYYETQDRILEKIVKALRDYRDKTFK